MGQDVWGHYYVVFTPQKLLHRQLCAGAWCKDAKPILHAPFVWHSTSHPSSGTLGPQHNSLSNMEVWSHCGQFSSRSRLVCSWHCSWPVSNSLVTVKMGSAHSIVTNICWSILGVSDMVWPSLNQNLIQISLSFKTAILFYFVNICLYHYWDTSELLVK